MRESEAPSRCTSSRVLRRRHGEVLATRLHSFRLRAALAEAVGGGDDTNRGRLDLSRESVTTGDRRGGVLRGGKRWLHVLTAGAPVVVLLGAALPADAAVRWLENPHMGVQLDGKPSGAARVFDSEDYQRMLLLLAGSPHAFVIDLGSSTVYQTSPDGMKEDAEGALVSEEPPVEYFAALENADGTLSFPDGDSNITLSPLPPLVGKATLERILEVKPAYRYDAGMYKPDPAKIAALKAVAVPTEIHVYFGTWCLSCKKLLPGLIKSIETAANPKISVVYYGVSEDLAEPAKEMAAQSVSKTPTVIVTQNGREIGRIEETAAATVEGDLAAILGSGK